jgi:hypothetical protein
VIRVAAVAKPALNCCVSLNLNYRPRLAGEQRDVAVLRL